MISARYGWLCNILPLVLGKFIERAEINPEDAKIAVIGIRIIETYRDYKDIDAKKEIECLCDLIKKHQVIKHKYLWEGAEYYQKHGTQRTPMAWANTLYSEFG